MNSFSDSTRKSGFQLFAKVTPPPMWGSRRDMDGYKFIIKRDCDN